MGFHITVGVLALQGAFAEHIHLLERARSSHGLDGGTTWAFIEVRTIKDLNQCDALIIPGGESTTVALIASRSGLLEPLREFVKIHHKPTWGTCAGLILLAESANRTKKGGQDLIGGLDVRVNRNHFGRQSESFEKDIELPFLDSSSPSQPFHAIFIRAPVVERLLPHLPGEQTAEAQKEDTVVAPAASTFGGSSLQRAEPVEILASLPRKFQGDQSRVEDSESHVGDVVAVRQGHVFGTSFHPELTDDSRIHQWWLRSVEEKIRSSSS